MSFYIDNLADMYMTMIQTKEIEYFHIQSFFVKYILSYHPETDKKEETMNAMENLLIIAGISLDIFAAMECQGALVAKVDKKQLGVFCFLWAVWQMAALSVGSYLAKLLYQNELAHDERFVGLVIAAVIFFALGLRQIVKAIRNERIHERREEDLGFHKLLRMAAVTGIYTLLTGIAFGFLGTNLSLMLFMVLCLTVAVVIAGVYTGYHLGFVHKTKAYICGAVLLWIAGIDVIVGHIMF